MTGIFDVHAVVALVNSYWRTDAEVLFAYDRDTVSIFIPLQIVLGILKQLPARIIDETVQAFITVTPKVRSCLVVLVTHLPYTDARCQPVDAVYEYEAAESQRWNFAGSGENLVH